MIDFFADPLAQGFMRRALLAGMVMGGAGALLGVFIVQRGLAFLSDGLAHATFGGMALGLLVGASADQALWVALPFTALVAVAIGAVRRGSGLGSDVATGVFFALAFALGVLFLGLRPAKDNLNVEALLFGSILAISPDVLVAMLVVAGLTPPAPPSPGRAWPTRPSTPSWPRFRECRWPPSSTCCSCSPRSWWWSGSRRWG